MAVNDSKDTNQNQTQAEANHPKGEPEQKQQTRSNPYENQSERMGMGSLNQHLRRSGSYDRSESRSSEALRGLQESRRMALESQALGDDFELVRFDRDANRVGLPSILVTKSVKVAGTVYTISRTLLLESEGIRLPARVEQFGNQRVEVPTRAQDVFNDTYWNRVTEFVRRSKGVMDMTVVDAGALLIPAGFDFKDDMVVSRVLISSVNRCDDVIAKLLGEAPFSIEQFRRNDERLTAKIDFTGQLNHTVTEEPVRSDLMVVMNRASAQLQKEDDYYERETEFNSVSGFINLEYAPAQQAAPVQWGQQAPETQLFTPSFVITDVAQADWIQAQTPELYLLAISNAYRVTAGTAWVRSFLPTVGKSGVDARDIGALGYMTPTAQRIETKSDSFTDEDFVQVMTTLVRPSPTFLMDVNPLGDHAAIENYFIDAAFGGPNQSKAIQRLIQAADNLTGGRFSQYFNAKDQAVVIPYGEVHLGYYIGDDGEKRDIRDLDVLAMLNLSKGNVSDFMDWYRTLCDANIPAALRLQQREGFERQFLGKDLKITGRAVRLLLTPAFIEALDSATRDAGLQVDLENVTNVMGAQRFVGNTMINQYTVSRNATMGYDHGAGVQSAGPSHAGVTSSGRLY